MDPLTIAGTLSGGGIDWMGLGSNILGKAMAGGAHSSANSVFTTTQGFDNSGWNVNIGGGSVSSTSNKTPMAGLTPSLPSYMWLVLGGLALVAAWKK